MVDEKKFKIKTKKQLENMGDNQRERYYNNLEKYRCLKSVKRNGKMVLVKTDGFYFDGNRFYFGRCKK